jgi:hypothetical protein
MMKKLFHHLTHYLVIAASQYSELTFIGGILLFVSVLVGFSSIPRHLMIFLPGTQPGTVDEVENVDYCQSCHYSESVDHPVTIAKDWKGSMMAHSARDPMFFAALAVLNKYNDAGGEWCIRCHSPSGWLMGRSKVPTGENLIGSDFDGVQCDYCHRVVNPLNPDTTVPPFPVYPVPGYGNGMHAFQRYPTPKRGPYDSVFSPHQSFSDSFQQTSELCGVCHDVSNPFYAHDRNTQAPHEYSPIERTYSEWKASWYATQGDSGSCQHCHMQVSPGYGCIIPGSPFRHNLRQHDLTGGNTFVPDILPEFWSGLDTLALQEGKSRAEATLQRAADLHTVAYRFSDTLVRATVKITNKTGHKLPTGYPEGRRMWLNLLAFDSSGTKIFESGKYEYDSAKLVYDSQIKIYEAKHGMTDAIAARYALQAGPSFHFGLNDTIYFDNRIPPKGFTNAAFQSRRAEPVGYFYPDSQYWDITEYLLPPATDVIIVKLMYQTISKEYIEFLRDENIGNAADWNQWGEKLYNAWKKKGKSSPVVMNTETILVKDTLLDVSPGYHLPSEFTLYQNYPNPFNPRTTIRLRLQAPAFTSLRVYDIFGKEIETLVNKKLETGNYAFEWNAENYASGIYFYRIEVADAQSSPRKFTAVKKMLLLK